MVATVLSKAAAQDGPVAVYGQDIDPTAGALAATWLVGDGVTSRVEVGDVFSADRYPDLQVDRIVTHPPFGPLRSEVPLDPDDPRWIYGEPAAGDAGAAWIQHCLFHLAEGGRAVIALPPRVLADRSKAGRVMQGIVKAGYLEAVIALPPRILPDTPVAPVLMVFAKGRERLDGKPAPTLMVDAEDVPTSGGRRERTLPIETIERLEAVVKAWTEGTPPESSDAAVATYDQIVENGFDLTPRRYVVQPGIEINTSALRKEALMLRGRLSSDIERSHLADASLLTLLEGGIR